MNFLLDPALAIYIAMVVALVVWVGVFIFLMRVDAQARDLRKKLDQLPATERRSAPQASLETRSLGRHADTESGRVGEQVKG